MGFWEGREGVEWEKMQRVYGEWGGSVRRLQKRQFWFWGRETETETVEEHWAILVHPCQSLSIILLLCFPLFSQGLGLTIKGEIIFFYLDNKDEINLALLRMK